jgi:hypothetical protein
MHQEWRTSEKPPFPVLLSPRPPDLSSPTSPSGEFLIFNRMMHQPSSHDAACHHPHFCALSRNNFSYVPISGPLTEEELSNYIGKVGNSLGQRGTGRHVCPYGRSCTKGGVETDGSMKVFGRNSAFRYHFLR